MREEVERYTLIHNGKTRYFFDPELKQRDYLYEYKVTGVMPYHIRMMQGGLKYMFVVKHYGKRTVMTRFPDMSKIIASKGQRKCRDLFKEAVAFAKKVIKDEDVKKEWQKRLKVPIVKVYNAAIKLYMLTAKGMIETKVTMSSKIEQPDGSWRSRKKSYMVPVTLKTIMDYKPVIRLREEDVGRRLRV